MRPKESWRSPADRLLRSRRRALAGSLMCSSPARADGHQLPPIADGIRIDALAEFPGGAVSGVDRGIDGARHVAVADRPNRLHMGEPTAVAHRPPLPLQLVRRVAGSDDQKAVAAKRDAGAVVDAGENPCRAVPAG